MKAVSGGEGLRFLEWEWEKGMRMEHSSLGTSARYREDREHDSLGMGLCTFYTELHANIGKTWLYWDFSHGLLQC